MREARLEIGLVTASYPPGSSAGPEIVARAQARELARLGQGVRVISGADWPAAGREVLRGQLDGLPVAYVPRERATDAGAVHETDSEREDERLTKLIANEARGLDLIHVHHWSTLTDGLVRSLSEIAPVVLTLHDFHASCPRSFRIPALEGVNCPSTRDLRHCARCMQSELGGNSLSKTRELLAARRASFEAELDAAALVLVPSASHLGFLSEQLKLDAERIRIHYHGLCQRMPQVNRRRAYWEGQRPLSVLHFGHRSARKGTLDLVRALAGLPTGTVELIMTGPEDERGFDARLEREAGDLALRFFGPYDAEQLASLAEICDIAAFPSRIDASYSLVIEEALALDLPVWVSDRGSSVEIIDSCATGRRSPGRVLPAGDPEAWRAAFADLFERPELLRQYRQAIPLRARTVEHAARELLEQYQSLIPEAAPSLL